MARRRRGIRRRSITATERIAVATIAAASAAGGALAGAHPTANRVSDVVVTAAFAAGVTVAASVARTWTLLAVAAVAAVFSSGLSQAIGAGLELVAIAFAVVDIRRRRVLGALLGAGSVQLLLRLGSGPFMGSSALLTGAVAVPVLISGWQLSRAPVRDSIRRAAIILGGVVVAMVLASAFSLVQARITANRAIDHAHFGLDAARQGDTKTAAAELAQSSNLFDNAHGDADSWWTKPAELVPMVGQQIASIDRLTAAGSRVTGVAAKASTEADVESLRLHSGTIDLQKIADAHRPLEEILTALHDASAAVAASQSPWLVAPLAHRIDSFAAELQRATGEADVAAQAVAVAPALLGGDGPRHYFVAFVNPAETRELGGIIGGWGELVADQGHLHLVQTGDASELNGGPPRTLTDPQQFPERFLSQQPTRFWQNLMGTPDFPTAAEAIRELWPQTGGGPIDGVLYVDPYALAGLLQLTGPVDAPALGLTLTTKNVVPFLLRDQYLQFSESGERHDLLSDAAKTVFDKVTSSDLPGPRQIADALSPVAQQGRLLLHSFHPDEQALFARLGIDGAAPAVDGDLLRVSVSNAGINKIDSFLSRSTEYDVQFDPATGQTNATAKVTLTNNAPASGLPDLLIGNSGGLPKGTNPLVLAVASPLSLDTATVDGAPLSIGAHTEYGHHVYTAGVAIPPGGAVTVELRLSGVITAQSEYRLTAAPQAAVGVEHLKVHVRLADGWRVTSLVGMKLIDSSADFDQDLPSAVHIGVGFRPK